FRSLGMRLSRHEDAVGAITSEALCLVRLGGQGRGRTADLPLMRLSSCCSCCTGAKSVEILAPTFWVGERQQTRARIRTSTTSVTGCSRRIGSGKCVPPCLAAAKFPPCLACHEKRGLQVLAFGCLDHPRRGHGDPPPDGRSC